MTNTESSSVSDLGRKNSRSGRVIVTVAVVIMILSLSVSGSPPAMAATYSKTVNVGGVVMTLAAEYSPRWDWNQRSLVNLEVTVEKVQSSSGDLRILGGVGTLHQNGTNHLLATSNPSGRLDNVLLTPGETYTVAFSFDHSFTGAQAGQNYTAHVSLVLNLLSEMANASKPYTFMNGDSDIVVSLNTSNPHPPELFFGLPMWMLLVVSLTAVVSVGGFLIWLARVQRNQPTTESNDVRHGRRSSEGSRVT